jgi:hypothetical protein
MALDRTSGLDVVVQGLREEAQHAAGHSIECQVCVSAVDARGHELYACLHLSQLNTETLWRPCVPRTQVPIDLAEVAPNLQGYRPVLPPRRSTRSGETQSGRYPAKRGNGPRIRVTGRVRSAGGSRSRSLLKLPLPCPINRPSSLGQPEAWAGPSFEPVDVVVSNTTTVRDRDPIDGDRTASHAASRLSAES